MTNRDRLYNKVAKKLGLTKKQVEMAFKSQFKFTYNIIGLRQDKPVRHPYFGVFMVKKGRRKYLDEIEQKYIKNGQQD